MRYIWEKVKTIFIEKYKEDVIETFKKEKLIYIGQEAKCWACDQSIHRSHRSRRLNGNKIHIKCFKTLKKIMLKGSKLHGF